MNTFIQILKKTYKSILITLFFLASIVLVVFLFPKERKFRYEFQKGTPWLHENLIAPYTFPVYKSEKEIKAEKDSIVARFSPYYRYDTAVGEKQIKKFESQFDDRWEAVLNRFDTLELENTFVDELQKDRTNTWKKRRYKRQIKTLLERIYDQGVIEFHDYAQDELLVVMKNKVAEEYYFDEVFTLRSAYEYLFDQLNIVRDEEDQEQLDEAKFIRELNLNEFLSPNLFYDKATSDKVLRSQLENVSPTQGLIQKGEGIIFRGEVVTDEKLRVLESLKKEYETSYGDSYSRYIIVAGQSIFVIMNYLILFLFLYHFRRDVLESVGKTVFILLLVGLFISISGIILKYNIVSLYIIPFVIIPIMIRIFYDTRLALFVHLTAILIIGFLAPNGFEFIFFHFSAGVIAIISLRTLRRRSQIFTTAVYIFFIYSFIYFGFAIMQEGEISSINWKNFAWFAGNSLLLISAYPLIYVFEKIFGFLSDVTLIELTDTNNPLLRKLAEQAPGTFQHSMQVANLAEEAVYSIGGNPLLARAGALYHDIGKLNMPQYFTENQMTGQNPHEDLDFEKSAEVIIDHVKRGVEMAHKGKLPEQIIDFIKTHHGSSKVEFFLRSYKKKYPEKEADINKFTYPFPKPFSKETAVMMMADSVEAASKSMKTITEESISQLVDKIINFQIQEGQLSDANVTFKEIEIVKKIFKKKIANIYHARIEYPGEGQ